MAAFRELRIDNAYMKYDCAMAKKRNAKYWAFIVWRISTTNYSTWFRMGVFVVRNIILRRCIDSIQRSNANACLLMCIYELTPHRTEIPIHSHTWHITLLCISKMFPFHVSDSRPYPYSNNNNNNNKYILFIFIECAPYISSSIKSGDANNITGMPYELKWRKITRRCKWFN